MEISSYWTSNVSYICEHLSAHALCNLPDSLKVDYPGICRRATDQQLWLVCLSQSLEFVIVNLLGFARDAIVRYLVT